MLSVTDLPPPPPRFLSNLFPTLRVAPVASARRRYNTLGHFLTRPLLQSVASGTNSSPVPSALRGNVRLVDDLCAALGGLLRSARQRTPVLFWSDSHTPIRHTCVSLTRRQAADESVHQTTLCEWIMKGHVWSLMHQCDSVRC